MEKHVIFRWFSHIIYSVFFLLLLQDCRVWGAPGRCYFVSFRLICSIEGIFMDWVSGVGKEPWKIYFLENKLLLISINFTPKTSHSCLKKWYTMFSRWLKFLKQKTTEISQALKVKTPWNASTVCQIKKIQLHQEFRSGGLSKSRTLLKRLYILGPGVSTAGYIHKPDIHTACIL